jgi:hypothetical protein
MDCLVPSVHFPHKNDHPARRQAHTNIAIDDLTNVSSDRMHRVRWQRGGPGPDNPQLRDRYGLNVRVKANRNSTAA